MTPDPRLNFLAELREAAGLTQAEVAQRFGLTGRQSYKSVAAWEKGESTPRVRLRGRFIRYLWDDLRLYKEPARFATYWELLVERWHWEPISEAEQAKLGLPSAPADDLQSHPAASQHTQVAGAAVQGDVTTGGGAFAGRDQYNFYGLPQLQQFVKRYRDEQDTLDEAAFESQLADYLRWVIGRTQTIELRGVKMRDGSQIAYLALEDAYVTLQASTVGGRSSDIALERILSTGRRLTVVGGPGCGKTTVLIYIAWVLAQAILENRPAWAQEKLGLRLDKDQPTLPLPIYLPLSAYARQRFRSTEQHNGEQTLPNFLRHYLRDKHSSLDRLPSDFLARLLAGGRDVILLLDGLDEVADEGQRRLVREAIENLVTSRDQIRVAVTCRTVAYQGRSVLARGFQQVNVQPLTDAQVAALVRKAYGCVYRQDEAEGDLKTAELLEGIAKLEADQARRGHKEERRLVDSPLMVRMLLVVHLSDRKLPQHRAELYKRFTETILQSDHAFDEEVAEALRKLAGNSPELLRALAFGMQQRGEQQGRDIDDETLYAILKPTFAAETDALIALTRLRGTLLEERDGLYRFMHLAFQEYLAACYLVDDYGVDEGFAAKVRFFSDGEILNSWWREVALLIPGYLSMGKRRLAERFVRMLAGLDEYQSTAANWSPDVQLAAAEIAATATLEWFPDDGPLRTQLVQRLLYFFNDPGLLNQTTPHLRALAGRALSALGDPRFRADAWYLPADPLLGFVELAAGTFTMGSDPSQDKAANEDEKPQHDVTLPAFYIARYPVTVGQFRAFVEATGEKLKYNFGLADPDNHPMTWVTWHEATRYCAWLTATLRHWDQTPEPLAAKLRQGWQLMLPSEAEWERAARGLSAPELVEGVPSTSSGAVATGGRLYPWGNEAVDPNRANYKATGIGTTSTVGSFPAGATPEGIEELAGNVYEWTRSRYLAYPYPSDEAGRRAREQLQAKDRDVFVLRGGSFFDGEEYMRVPLRDLTHAGRNLYADDGFRVVCGAAPRQLDL